MSEAKTTIPLGYYRLRSMKWHIRKNFPVEKSQEPVTLEHGVYHSRKGFVCAEKKLSIYCLSENGKHAKEFYSAGYKPTDSERLIRDLHDGFDWSKRGEAAIGYNNSEVYTINMPLGVGKKRNFATIWQIDAPGMKPKFITAYRYNLSGQKED